MILRKVYCLRDDFTFSLYITHLCIITAQDVCRRHGERPAAARLLLEVCCDSHRLPSQLQVQRHCHDAALDLVQGHRHGSDGRQRHERTVETERNVVS